MMKKDDKLFGAFALTPAIIVLIMVIVEAVFDCEFLIGSVNSRLFTAIMFSLSAILLFIPLIKNLINKDKKKKLQIILSDYFRYYSSAF